MNSCLIVITGTTRGLGRELKKRFNGSFNLLCINRAAHSKNGLSLDLSEREIDLKKFAEEIEKYKKIIFISNASTIYPIKLLSSVEEYELEDSIYTNYINPCKIILAIIKSEKEFLILNITSGAAFTANNMLSLYSSSKAAMYRFIEILKKEQENNANALFIDNFDPGRMQTNMQRDLIKRFGIDEDKVILKTPESVANKIYILIGNYL